MEIIAGIIIGILWHIASRGKDDEEENWESIRRNLLKEIDKEEKEGIKREKKG